MIAVIGSLYRLRVDWFKPDTKQVFSEVTIDYKAGAKARYQEYAESAAQRRDNHPWSWYELPPIPKAKFRHDAKVTINAALGITTEDTDE